MTKSYILLLTTALALGACGQGGRGSEQAGEQADGTDAATGDMATSTASPTTPRTGGTGGMGADPAMRAGSASDPSMAAMQPASYVASAASGDMFEIESSQLALKKSRDPAVQSFASQMVKDHRATTAQLKEAAKAADATVPTQMQPRHAQMLTALTNAGGADFDRLYWEQQRTAHAEAVDLHRAMSQRGDLPGGLSGFAKSTLPKVEGHYRMLTEQGRGGAAMSGGAAGAGTSASGSIAPANPG